MNKTTLSVALITTAAGIPQAAAAEPVCFMEFGNRQMIDLSSLCGSAPVVVDHNRSIAAPERIPLRSINKSVSPISPSRWQQKIWYR